MCGVAGGWLANGCEKTNGEVSMLHSRLAHRGPHGHGLLWLQRAATGWVHSCRMAADGKARLALAHTRLATTAAGNLGIQPRVSSDGRLILSWNGEIYNHLELIQRLGISVETGDSDLLLAAWAAWGPDCLSRINGMWSLAIADLQNATLTLARDRFGIRPLYYCRRDNDFFFASESAPLASLPGLKRLADPGSIYDFLTAGAVELGSSTFFKGIHRLPPGYLLQLNLDQGCFNLRRWYVPPLQTQRISPGDAAVEVRRLLQDSVQIRSRARLAVGICASGGMDSGAILKLTETDQITAVFTSQPREIEANEEKHLARIMAGSTYPLFTVRPDGDDLARQLDRLVRIQDEPFATPGVFAQWLLCRRAAESGVRILLDGQGADELLAGYHGLGALRLDELKRQGKLAFIQGLLQDFNVGRTHWKYHLQAIFPLPAPAASPGFWLNHTFADVESSRSQLAAIRRLQPFGSESLLRNLLHQLTFHDNLPGLLRYADRSGMASGVEGRFPFLDHRLAEFSTSLPVILRMRGGWTKRVLRDATKSILPDPIRWRRDKLGFATPDQRWLRGPLQPMVLTALDDERLDHFIDRSTARQAFLAGCQNNRPDQFAWRILILQRWLEVHDVQI